MLIYELLGYEHLEEGIWSTPLYYFSLSPYLLFVYISLVHVHSIIMFSFIFLGDKLNLETHTGPGRPFPASAHLPTGKNWVINNPVINLLYMMYCTLISDIGYDQP